MINLEIKKAILEDTKRIKEFHMLLILWHGDENKIYNEIVIYEGLQDYSKIISNYYFGSELEDTDENIKTLKTEQKKMYNYLKKHFNNVTVIEQNV